MGPPPHVRDPIDAIAALAEPTRRALYEHVAASPEPVARDDAAAALAIGRPLAAFHLDRLVVAGLLEVEYRRRGSRRGPGAGRPAKLYRQSASIVDVSLPTRRYDLAAELLAEAVAAGDGTALAALSAAARERGRALAGAVGATGDPAVLGADAGEERPPGSVATAERLLGLLAATGFRPRTDRVDGTIRLANCPFEALAREHRDVACPMNLALLEGVVAMVGGFVAMPDETPGYCCVRLRPIGGA